MIFRGTEIKERAKNTARTARHLIFNEWRTLPVAWNAIRSSNDRQLIFMHVPKCAGTSVTRYCNKFYDSRLLGSSVNINEALLSRAELDHSIHRARKAAFVHGHISWATMRAVCDKSPTFIFTFLRDPLNRLLSEYRYHMGCDPNAKLRAGWSKDLQARQLQNMSMRQYFACDVPEMRYGNDNYMVRQFAGDLHTIPCSETEWNSALEVAKQNMEQMNQIGFQDKFTFGFREFLTATGLRDTGEVPYHNLSKGSRHYESADLDKRTMDVVAPLIRYDVELYSWARNRFNGGVLNNH